jgi:phosphate transport system ATP-binding protein
VEQFSSWYGDKPVHRGISFHVEANEIFGIIGPAQSGKTTLLRAINRTWSSPPALAPPAGSKWTD